MSQDNFDNKYINRSKATRAGTKLRTKMSRYFACWSLDEQSKALFSKACNAAVSMPVWIYNPTGKHEYNT